MMHDMRDDVPVSPPHSALGFHWQAPLGVLRRVVVVTRVTVRLDFESSLGFVTV